MATIEFTIEKRHTLQSSNIAVQLNGQTVTQEMCTQAQAQIDALNSDCVTKRQLCTVFELTSDDLRFVSYVVPVVASQEEIKIDVVLKTDFLKDDQTTTEVVSTLNFATRQPPVEVCECNRTIV